MSEQQSIDDASVSKVRRFFAFLAILLAMISQIFIYTTPAPYGDKLQDMPGSFWIAIAGVLLGILVFIWSQVYRPSQRIQAFFARFRFSWPISWIIVSFILSLISVLTMVLFVNYGRTNYIPVLTFWLFAAICYIAGFSKSIPSVSQCQEWLKLHRYELAGLGLITLLGAVLRFYKLGEIPRVINGDEGRIGLTALSTNTYPYVNPFALWENFGALYLQSINYLFSVFGVSAFSLRLLPAIGGTLAIPALYLLARQISGRRIALIAASLLTISHTHIHFSRTVAVAYIQGTWLIPLELYFLLSGLVKRSSWRTAIGGILLAIHFSIYLDSQIIAALILVYMALAFLFFRAWFKPALPQASVFWGGFAITILPELVFILQRPDEFFNRLGKDGTFQSGWLAQEIVITGHNPIQILAERVIHAFFSLIYYRSFDFYGSSIPMLSLISATLFLLGLGIVLWKVRSPGFLLLNGWFWAGTLAIGIFAIPVSADTYRMLLVLPAALFMAAIGFDRALHALGLGWTQARKVYISATALTLFSLLIFNIWAYYFQFAGRCLYGLDDPPTRFASYLGRYASTLDKQNKTYLLSDDTFLYGTHQSVDFLSGKLPIINVPESVDTMQVKPRETIIANLNRIEELRTWADNNPGGVLHYEYDCEQIMLLSYQFP
jgi:4-amino-4-deoxy-L-arabinose transferase-like glycosyltransferase